MSDKIEQYCDALVSKNESQMVSTSGSTFTISNKSESKSTSQLLSEQSQPPVEIEKTDLENLRNYVDLWTNVIETDVVEQQYHQSDFDSIDRFKEINHLVDVGFFYVQIDTKLSVIEFFNNISKIPWDKLLCIGTNQISYSTISQMFGDNYEKIAIQLMVLGSYLGFWELINPYDEMKLSGETTRLLLSGMGNLMIVITPNLIEKCSKMLNDVYENQS